VWPVGCGKTTLPEKLWTSENTEGDYYWMSGRTHAERHSYLEVFACEFQCAQTPEEIVKCLALWKIVVIDDFHHLKQQARNEIGKLLKLWHEQGIRIFIIGIAESAHQLLEMIPKLGIRNDPYDMKVQGGPFIRAGVAFGEAALNLPSRRNEGTFRQSGPRAYPPPFR